VELLKEVHGMRDALNYYAARLQNRIPETLAAICLLAGIVACALILRR
jgi:hypothetical protein